MEKFVCLLLLATIAIAIPLASSRFINRDGELVYNQNCPEFSLGRNDTVACICSQVSSETDTKEWNCTDALLSVHRPHILGLGPCGAEILNQTRTSTCTCVLHEEAAVETTQSDLIIEQSVSAAVHEEHTFWNCTTPTIVT